jgi:hypothetical protein
MSIRIGANPIGWSNDDLQEIGGDTPLETCLAEAKEAGVVGMEKGHGPGRRRGAEGEARFVRSRRRGWCRNPVPPCGRGWGEETGAQAPLHCPPLGADPHPALRATFSRKGRREFS